MLVEPDAIYLIPPKKEMIISGGPLLLTDKDPGTGLSLPIDIFFRSLAQDLGDRAVAIVLSGTGSDGSRGIRAMHEAGGLVIVQDEETAKFDGMPQSAVETGVVDLVLPLQERCRTLCSTLSNTRFTVRKAAGPAPPVTQRYGHRTPSISLLRAEYGIDFSHYKPNTVWRRIDRRLQLNHSLDLDEYVNRSATIRDELNSLYSDLLIGVTRFFRDHGAFDRLESEVLPQVAGQSPLRRRIPRLGRRLRDGRGSLLAGHPVPRRPDGSKIARVNVKIFRHGRASRIARRRQHRHLSRVELRRSLARGGWNAISVKQGSGYQVSQDLRKDDRLRPRTT